MPNHRASACSLALALGIALAGCKSTPPAPKPEVALQELASRGYAGARHSDTTALRETWVDGETPLDVSLIEPVGQGPFPLVIYLPGLGESAAAGVLWRQAWAASGYAVLAIQPVDLGESVFRSDKARAGDFLGLAQEHFSAAALKTRTQHLTYALGEMRRRASASVEPYSRIDLSRLALAGFDLGAQSVAALIGTHMAGVGPSGTGWNIRAAILLSPYVDRPGGDVTPRPAEMSVPVLLVTGTEDRDPFGLVSAPELRRGPWKSMPAGDKYLLLLSGGAHGVLAGDGFAEAGQQVAQTNDAAQDAGAGPPQGTRQKGRRGGRGSQAANSRRAAGDDRAVRGPRPFEVAHIAAVRGVTTAFLDAAVQNDPVAREWLTKSAPGWLGGSARLETR